MHQIFAIFRHGCFTR